MNKSNSFNDFPYFFKECINFKIYLTTTTGLSKLAYRID